MSQRVRPLGVTVLAILGMFIVPFCLLASFIAAFFMDVFFAPFFFLAFAVITSVVVPVSYGLWAGRVWARSISIFLACAFFALGMLGSAAVHMVPGGAPGGLTSHIIYYFVGGPVLVSFFGGIGGTIADFAAIFLITFIIIYYLKKPHVKAYFSKT